MAINKENRIDRRAAIKTAVTISSGIGASILSRQTIANEKEKNQNIQSKGEAFSPIEGSNPLNAKIITFTTISKDVDKSIEFYRDVIGMTVFEDKYLPKNVSSIDGIGHSDRRHVLLTMPESPRSAAVRILEASPSASPIRPRPESGPMDPGLLVMEGSTKDPAMSYHTLKSAKVPMISPPRYYYFRNTMWKRDIDVMSYSPFGPGGEQLFLTANIRSDRPERDFPGLHGGFSNAAITSLDQRPVNDFFEKTLGLKRTSQMECYQKNTNELIGAPEETYFLWGNLASGVSIEVWEVKASSGVIYPCALDKTGLAMLTIRVDDLSKCREMCYKSGIKPIAEGALPNQVNKRPNGFMLRGAVGEIFEIVQS